MVYGRRAENEEMMPQTVPSAGFTPPCDYSAFAADSFDLSLLPGGDSDLPLSPSTSFYTQSPPPMSYKSDKSKVYTTYYPSSPEERDDIELGPDFQKLLSPEPKKTNGLVFHPQSPAGARLEVPNTNLYPNSPVGTLSPYSSSPEQNFKGNLLSPGYSNSPSSQYPSSPGNVVPNIESNNYLSNHYVKIGDKSPSFYPNSPEETLQKLYSPIDVKDENPSPRYRTSSPQAYLGVSSPKQDIAINLHDILEESNFLQSTVLHEIKIKQESTVDFGEILQDFSETSTEGLREILDDNYKKLEPEATDGAAKQSSQQDHKLLRQVLKDTSFQKKFNLKPFDFELTSGLIGACIKMEQPDDTSADGDLLEKCNEELSRESIEPVLSMAIEQMRKDIDNTCSALSISADPSLWTNENARAWLQWTVQQFTLPGVQVELFDLPGSALAALTEEEFTERAPQSGSILYAQLEIWKTACLEDDISGIMQWNSSSNLSSNASSGDISDDEDDESIGQQAGGGKASTSRTGGGSHIHLWQFLKELLASPQLYGSCIRWLDRGRGVFKIEDSVRVAKLWGKRKNRPAMNYDKLSRSIRQYYKKGIMKKTERSQRLVYQFCHPYSL